jgi:HNH endonuclease
MAEIPDDVMELYIPNLRQRINRANQFLDEYTEEGAEFSVTYLTVKRHYYSYCRLIGLTYSEYGYNEILRVLDRKSALRCSSEERAMVIGLRMKHPVGLPRFYSSQERKGLTVEVKREVFRQLQDNGNICGICGLVISSTDKVHIDHIVPVRRGGTNEASNLQVVHEKCNLVKG